MLFEVDNILKHTVRTHRLILKGLLGDKNVTRNSVDIKGEHKVFNKVFYILIISNCQLCILKRQDICTYITQILISR